MSDILAAVLKQDTEEVRMLLEDLNINPNIRNDEGETLLHISIKQDK